MRKKKERSKQGQTNKQGRATQHTQGSEKTASGGTPTHVHVDCAALVHITSIVCTLKASVGVKYNNTKEVYYVNISHVG